MTRTIAMFLNLAQIDDLGLSLSRRPFPLHSLIEREVQAVRSRHEDIELHLRFSDADQIVESDEDMVREIVSNLLDNAAKYAGGRPIQVRASRNGEFAQIAVADEGPGIAPEHLDRLFDRFSRGAESQSKPKGTGLGLYISGEMARVLGGRIDIDSTVGRGSTFTLGLPV